MADSPVESAPLGSDFAGVFDLCPSLTIVTGRRCHLEAVARSLLQDEKSCPDAPHIGLGLAAMIGEDYSDGDVRALAGRAEKQCLYDERTEAATVNVTDDGTDIVLEVGLEDSEGPFSFVLSPSELTVDGLKLKR